jgi:hypothetical protein
LFGPKAANAARSERFWFVGLIAAGPGDVMTPRDDETLLRRAFEVARRSRANGDHPFGALLAGT